MPDPDGVPPFPDPPPPTTPPPTPQPPPEPLIGTASLNWGATTKDMLGGEYYS